MEVVSTNIISTHLKRECIHTPSWEQSKSGVCEAPKAKQKETKDKLAVCVLSGGCGLKL